jgi:hypothetical protein
VPASGVGSINADARTALPQKLENRPDLRDFCGNARIVVSSPWLNGRPKSGQFQIATDDHPS